MSRPACEEPGTKLKKRKTAAPLDRGGGVLGACAAATGAAQTLPPPRGVGPESELSQDARDWWFNGMHAPRPQQDGAGQAADREKRLVGLDMYVEPAGARARIAVCCKGGVLGSLSLCVCARVCAEDGGGAWFTTAPCGAPTR